MGNTGILGGLGHTTPSFEAPQAPRGARPSGSALTGPPLPRQPGAEQGTAGEGGGLHRRRGRPGAGARGRPLPPGAAHSWAVTQAAAAAALRDEPRGPGRSQLPGGAVAAGAGAEPSGHLHGAAVNGVPGRPAPGTGEESPSPARAELGGGGGGP